MISQEAKNVIAFMSTMKVPNIHEFPIENIAGLLSPKITVVS